MNKNSQHKFVWSVDWSFIINDVDRREDAKIKTIFSKLEDSKGGWMVDL
jgi:hypothetical protein